MADLGLQIPHKDIILAPGCSRGTTILSEDFESDYADEDELSTQHGWTEVDATTNIYNADTAQAASGSYSGRMAAVGSNANRRFIKEFSSFPTTGYFSATAKIRTNDAGQINPVYSIREAAENSIVNLYIDASGNLKVRSNTTWTTVASGLVADTWYTIEIQVDADQADGIGAVYVWFDGTQYGPYDTDTRRDPDDSYEFSINKYDTSTSLTWIDDITVYLGQRCNP